MCPVLFCSLLYSWTVTVLPSVQTVCTVWLPVIAITFSYAPKCFMVSSLLIVWEFHIFVILDQLFFSEADCFLVQYHMSVQRPQFRLEVRCQLRHSLIETRCEIITLHLQGPWCQKDSAVEWEGSFGCRKKKRMFVHKWQYGAERNHSVNIADVYMGFKV